MTATITVNGEARPYERRTLAELMSELGVAPGASGVAVARNETVVPKGAWEATAIEPGDRIEIVRIVRGG